MSYNPVERAEAEELATRGEYSARPLLAVDQNELDALKPTAVPDTCQADLISGPWSRTLAGRWKWRASNGESGSSTSAGSDEERGEHLLDALGKQEVEVETHGRSDVAPGTAIPSIRQSYRFYRYIVLFPLFYLVLLGAFWYLGLGSIAAGVWVSMFKSSGPVFRSLLLLGGCIGPLKRLASLTLAAKSYDCPAGEETHVLAKRLRLRHMIVIPAYKESVAVLSRTLESLPRKIDPESSGHDVHVVLAMEAKDSSHAATFSELERQFGHSFASLRMTVHTMMPHERPGKGSNENYALRTLRAELLSAGVDTWEVMVTVCDADSVFAPDFFAALESAYIGQIDGRRLIYSAPRNTYRNFGKLWNPLISAQECSMNSSDMFVDLTEPYENYSNYSMLMGYAAELDFWDTEVIPEDFHMVYRSMICSRGSQSVCRVWSLISNDSVTDFSDRYVQAKRHTWGVTTIAWIAAILQQAPFSIDRIWYHLLKAYFAEMSETLMPPSAALMILGLSAWCRPPADAMAPAAFMFLGEMILIQWLLKWLVFFIGEAWVWRCMMGSIGQHVERPSWHQVVWHYGLMPVTQPIAAFIFGNVACWHSVCNAFWSSDFEYVTAPKA